jgi:hypothetical protein
MTIQRFEVGPRMSQVVVHGNTVYLAGVVAGKAAGKSVTEQTQDILGIIDGHLEIAVGDDLHHRHEDLPGNERGVGRLDFGRQYPGPRHRRSQAGGAAVQCRDHGHRGEVKRSVTAVIASEAKQSIWPQGSMDCFVAYAPRNDERRLHAAFAAVRSASILLASTQRK